MMGSLEYKPLASVLQSYNWKDNFRSLITFVQDAAGNKYIVKQYRYNLQFKSFLASSICELVALDIGHFSGVPLNVACLIPAGVPFIGKETMAPASLHALVPGMPFNEYLAQNKGMYHGLDLNQKRPLGLTRDLIYHMSRHKDFPDMVALDTFVSNGSRWTHNFFYDEVTNRFYGIDMASSFIRDLCEPSIANIKSMLVDEHVRFTKAEGKALVRYYRTFKKLVKLYSPKLLCEQLDIYAERAGFYDSSFFDKEVQASCLELLLECKNTIRISYGYAPQFVNILKQLLEKHALL